MLPQEAYLPEVINLPAVSKNKVLLLRALGYIFVSKSSYLIFYKSGDRIL